VSAIPAQTLLHAAAPALVDPVRQRRARAIADYQDVLFVAWALAPVVAFLWLWRSGNAARLRDALRRSLRAAWLQRAVFGAALGTLATLAQVPLAFASYRVAYNVGLTTQTIPAWFLEELLRVTTIAAGTALLVVVILALVDATRLWYLAFIALLYATVLLLVAVEPVLFSPLASHDVPAPAAVVAQGDDVARALGTAPVPLVISASARTSSLLSRTSGLGPFERIIIGNRAVAVLTPGERAFLLARQYAHVRERDVLWLTLAATTLFVLAAALAVLVSDRIGFRRDDDALARLALVGAFLGLAVVTLYPGYNAFQRGIERRTDAIAASVAAPADGARLFVRRADDDLEALCGRRTVRWYFAARPPLGSRIAALAHTPDPCPR
jgi:Zn-dependent protease with chaperone function